MAPYRIWYTLPGLTDDGNWLIGNWHMLGGKAGFATVEKDIPFLDSTTNWEWEWAPSWNKANKGLGVKGIYLKVGLYDGCI